MLTNSLLLVRPAVARRLKATRLAELARSSDALITTYDGQLNPTREFTEIPLTKLNKDLEADSEVVRDRSNQDLDGNMGTLASRQQATVDQSTSGQQIIVDAAICDPVATPIHVESESPCLVRPSISIVAGGAPAAQRNHSQPVIASNDVVASKQAGCCASCLVS